MLTSSYYPANPKLALLTVGQRCVLDLRVLCDSQKRKRSQLQIQKSMTCSPETVVFMYKIRKGIQKVIKASKNSVRHEAHTKPVIAYLLDCSLILS